MLLDYKQWDKSTKNWVVAAASALVAAVVIWFFPVGNSPAPATKPTANPRSGESNLPPAELPPSKTPAQP
jgi:hypothetical protein